MRANLEYLRRYRATITIDPTVKMVITDQMILTGLARWQLFGQVTETARGYKVEAEFRGKTGTYILPNEVETWEIIG